MSIQKQEVCIHCGREIKKGRYPEPINGRVWGWATLAGRWYCPQAGGDCFHHPKGEPRP